MADGFVGRRTFEALTLLADLQAANGKAEAAAKTMDEAIASTTAGPIDIHQYGRRLMREGKPKEALAVFQLNARRHPDQWPVHVGLARGYSAVGDLKKALEHARLALAQAPDEVNRKSLEKAIETLSAGKPWSCDVPVTRGRPPCRPASHPPPASVPQSSWSRSSRPQPPR